MSIPVVTLIGKPGCHLCDEARMVVTDVTTALQADSREVSVEERSILEDEALREQYADDIPVVLIDGAFHSRWHVDPVALRGALA